jgi:transcriptional regulator with XRE-family HTH domain
LTFGGAGNKIITMQKQKLAERVRELREARNWSQNDLAERAELPAPALSRILSGEREPRIQHLLALANAFEIAVFELVAETDAVDAVGQWVRRENFTEVDRARAGAMREAADLRSKVAARDQEIETLRQRFAESVRQVEESNRTNTGLRAQAARAEQLSRELADARSELTLEKVSRECSERNLTAAEGERDRAIEQANVNYFAWHNAVSRIQQLQFDLQKAKGGQWLTATIGALGGALVAAAAEEPPSSGKRRRRRT